MFAQSAPAIQITPRQRVFDEADDGMVALQLVDDGEDRSQRAVVVKVPMDLETWRRNRCD